VDAVFAWLHEVDRRFNTYDAESEISRLNRGELALADAHADVRWILDRCEELRVETGGYFDVRAASDAIDPTSTASATTRSTPAGTSCRAAARSPRRAGASASATRCAPTASRR
jgi:thiamine biosynthesis lipoprotein